ncbi:SpoIIE family protein phosphatase [bacterium]|nr:SpoIIE family protein phosphatase [bacterium]
MPVINRLPDAPFLNRSETLPMTVRDRMSDETSPANALARLLEIALELGAERDLDQILKIATTGVCQAVGCERASLFIHDDSKRELYTRVVTELEISEIRFPLMQGIVGWVAQHRQLLSVPVPAEDHRWDSSVDKRTGFKTRNILATPVLAGDQRLLGVLQLLNKRDRFAPLDEQLVQAFAAHVAVALERRRLEDEAHRALELRQAMEMGHRIQATFLPTRWPEVPGYEVASWWQPAEFVSGDYYDWLPLPQGRWGFLVGDVSGHGLAAALIMATLRAMAHVLSRTLPQASDFIETLRDSLTPDLQNSRFVTCCYVVLDPESHELTWANAGHAPAFAFDRARKRVQRLEPTTIPLGFPTITWPTTITSRVMQPGDLLVLGTDGVVEVRNPAGEMYGHARLEKLVANLASQSAEEIIAAIQHDVTTFHGLDLPPDDTTVVIVRRTP